MRQVILFVIVLVFVSETLGDDEINVRISDGSKSGKLEFQDNGGSWGAVCLDGFDQDAADVACRQLGYSRASELYTYYSSYGTTEEATLCSASCAGDEEDLGECFLLVAVTGHCFCTDIVGITCTNTLDIGVIVAIVLSLVGFIAFCTTFTFCCFCCSSCPLYYKKSSTRTVVVTRQIQQEITTMPPTSANNTTHGQPPAPPTYSPDTGYQPYPAVPPTATTAKM